MDHHHEGQIEQKLDRLLHLVTGIDENVRHILPPGPDHGSIDLKLDSITLIVTRIDEGVKKLVAAIPPPKIVGIDVIPEPPVDR